MILCPDFGLDCTMSATVFREIVMSINKTRGYLYKLARLLGDTQAISSGNPKKMTKRVGRRVTGRAAGKTMRKLFK